MPDIPTDVVLADSREKLHEGHVEMRELALALGADALNWRPGSETNSIAALVAHALDGERAIVAAVADIAIERDREAQFAVEVARRDELVGLVDRLEAEIDRYLELIDARRLTSAIERTTGTRDGLGWLLHVVSHSREHLGQASLTRQLYEQAHAARG